MLLTQDALTKPNWGEHTDKLMCEWDFAKNDALGLDMMKVTKGSTKRVWWRCSNHSDHVWDTRMDNRTRIPKTPSLNNGCSFCSNHQVLVGFDDLGSSITHEDVTSEWHPTLNNFLTPQDVTVSSGKKVWWECSVDNSHVYDARIVNRTNLGRGCPTCSHQKVKSGFNDLASTVGFENIVNEWHPTLNGTLTPQTVTAFTPKSVWWMCSKNSNHVWSTSVKNRTVRGHGCSKCSTGKTERAFMESFEDITGVALISEKIELYRVSRKTNIAQIDGRNVELMLVVEYDGYFPHSGIASKKDYSEIHAQDCETTEALLNAGYKVVRIREHSRNGKLPNLEINIDNLAYPATIDNLLQVSYKSFGKAGERDSIQDVVQAITALKGEWFVK